MRASGRSRLMHIVCDENLLVTPSLRAIASRLTRLPGRHIHRNDLRDAEALLVRSVTRVDAALLKGTPVKFVGTATAGTEHIDVTALARLGIRFASAPGANANAVVEYVLACITLARRWPGLLQPVAESHPGDPLAGPCRVGIVGYGHVGKHLARVLTDLGARIRVWDPWADVPVACRAQSLEEILTCSVISLHADLHDRNPWPSCGLLDRQAAARIPGDTVLINAGRGGLVTREALGLLATAGNVLMLDTWPDEPAIDPVLLQSTTVATPHIAGYSLKAKAEGTDQLVRALMTDGEGIDGFAVDAVVSPLELNIQASEPVAWLSAMLMANYNVLEDDRILRNKATADGIDGATFDSLRRDYRLRKELRGQTIQSDIHCARCQQFAAALGCSLTPLP